jgi:glycosyltransferase involved in cell wall biosynthesis
MNASTRCAELRIIVPAYASMETLQDCIAAIQASSSLGPHELCIVDDGRNPGLEELAGRRGVTVVRSLMRNASLARNAGAESFAGEYIVFVDADVQIEPHALQELLQPLQRGESDATYGRYSTQVDGLNFYEQYKQLYISRIYGRAEGTVEDFFWTAICAVRRSAFETVGGFDSRLPGHIGEDVDLGQRLTRARYRVRNVPWALGRHLKHFSLGSVLRNDFKKGASTVFLSLRAHAPLAHNPHAKGADKGAVALCLVSLVAGLWALLGIGSSTTGLQALGVTLLAYLAVRHEFVALHLRQGAAFALRAVPLMYLLDGVRVLSLAAGVLAYLLSPRTEQVLVGQSEARP